MKSFKKLKQVILNNLTPKDFFMSDIFRQHFSGIVKMVSGRYGNERMEVKTGWGGEAIAYTDNRKVFVNLNNELISGNSDIEDRYLCCLGLLGHELGHVLYTDFDTSADLCEGKYGNYLGLTDEEKKIIDESVDYRNNGFDSFITKIYHHISNSIEDGFVNRKISEAFPGTFKSGIKRVQSFQFAEDFRSTGNELVDTLNIILSLSIGRKVPNDVKNAVGCYKSLKAILKDIDLCETVEERFILTNKCFVTVWAYIKNLLDMAKQMPQSGNGGSQGQGEGSFQGDNDSQAGNSQGSSSGQSDSGSQENNSGSGNSSLPILKKVLSQVKESSSEGKGNGILNNKNGQSKDENGMSGNQKNNTSAKEQSENNTKSSKNSSKPDSNGADNESAEEKGKEDSSSASGSDNNSTDNASKEKSSLSAKDVGSEDDVSDDNNSDSDKKSGENTEGENSETEAEKNGDKDSDDGESSFNKNADNGNSVKSEDSENGSDNSDGLEENENNRTNMSEIPADVTFDGQSGNGEEDAESALEGLLSRYAQKYIEDNPEKTEKLSMDSTAMEISNGKNSPHSGYPYEVTNIKGNKKSDYETAARNLSGISKRLQKRVEQVLEDQNEGGTCKNLLKGNKINPAASASSNGKIFKRNILPETKDIAISLLIDESGSMCGKRIQKALEMAIIIEDFCAGLNIPLSVVGHSDSCKVIIRNYIRFEDINKNRKYNLAEMRAGGCNRDGFALKYCVDNLLERDEENKLMIIVSDGRPNSNWYSGQAAEEDLKNIKREFERKGGRLIAAAIGEDRDTIKRIYGNSFLDVSDVNNLPLKMASLISRYVQD